MQRELVIEYGKAASIDLPDNGYISRIIGIKEISHKYGFITIYYNRGDTADIKNNRNICTISDGETLICGQQYRFSESPLIDMLKASKIHIKHQVGYLEFEPVDPSFRLVLNVEYEEYMDPADFEAVYYQSADVEKMDAVALG